METLEQVKKWLSELLYRTNDIEDHFIIDGNCVNFYTKNNEYIISFHEDDYLGCQVSSRKPRAGETWTRGNDLPDGKFNEETWIRIKNAIISYELVKIVKKEKSIINQDIHISNDSDYARLKPSERRGEKPEKRPLY